MRLWHEKLIPILPRQQLLGQHSECCALRGHSWGEKHRIVDYVFQYSPMMLYKYHMKVMNEMKKRGYSPNLLWENPYYRGKLCPPYEKDSLKYENSDLNRQREYIYPEHNNDYLQVCLENLRKKGINLYE